MEIKILRVFYGEDGLPYKDQERTVHFPIVGSGFQGASNTTKIRFYFQEIGNINVSYVAVSKLPNGKIGSKVLTTAYDSEVGEYYAEMTLDSYYFQYKGDVFISLQGYQGDIEVTYDDQEEVYEIKGTPTIKATGSIKMSVNYAPQFVGSGEEDNATLEDILSLVGTKADANKVMNRLKYNASGKTIADLFDFVTQSNIDPDPSIIAINLRGITNSGIYILIIVKTTGLDQYYIEAEKYATGVRSSQDRWVAAGISGSMTVEDLLTTYNDYYAPYLVNGNRINYDTATMEQLHLAVGNVPHIIGLYGESAFANVYGGYFLIKFSEDSQGNLNFTALRLSNHAQGYTDFYYGANIPTSTLVSAVFNHSTSYYKPLVTKPQMDSALETKQDVLTFDNEPTAGSNNPVTSKGIKSYVDDLVASIEQDELQEVNTTTYPTLQSFLASTGREGIIYLYPVDAQDLTKGYHKYTWETDHYIYLGDTNIDLSNLATKDELNSAVAPCVKEIEITSVLTTNDLLESVGVGKQFILDNMGDPLLTYISEDSGTYSISFVGKDKAYHATFTSNTLVINLLSNTELDIDYLPIIELSNPMQTLTSSQMQIVNQDNSVIKYGNRLYHKCNIGDSTIEFVCVDYDMVDEGPNQKLTKYEITVNKTSGATTTITSYIDFYSKSEIDSTLYAMEQRLMEAIEGKTNTYVIDDELEEPTEATFTANTYKRVDGTYIETWADFISYLKYDHANIDTPSFANGDFASQDQVLSIHDSYIITQNNIVVRIHVGWSALSSDSDLNEGDALFTINNSLERWVGIVDTQYVEMYIINTLPDLTGYVTLDTAQNITGFKTFSNGFAISGVQLGTYYFMIGPDGIDIYGTSTDKVSLTSLLIRSTLYGTTYSATVDQLCSQFNPTDAGTTVIKWTQMLLFTLSADTTFTFESAKSGCLNEYKAIITNSGSSAITITLPASVNIETNDDSITISSNTFTLPSGTTVELNCVNLWCIVYNHNAQ